MGTHAITLSLSDPAGQTIFELLKKKGFVENCEKNVFKKGKTYLFIIEPLIVPQESYMILNGPKPYPVDYDLLAEKYEIEYIIVVSRHWAKSGEPSFTMHPTGNFGKAVYGGRPKELQNTAPNVMRDIYLRLLEDPPRNFKVSLEATHHGPTMFNVPMFFAEVGSRETQWRNREVCNYLVESILKGVRDKGEASVAIGFGGGHYCPYFSSKIFEYAFGHISAKYCLPLLTEDLVEQMIEKSGKVDYAIFDSGLKSKEKKKIKQFLSDKDLIIE
jgi:D-aminoacyl-tRNA deacylase